MSIQEAKQYNAAIYLRLSREDGDKEESDSIGNQRDLLLDFVKSIPDINVHSVRIDDGYTGVNFNRPAFIAMLEDIKAGSVNCVVVKDFSRFGRNYIDAGRYIQILFPQTGVRFIAVTDGYDSIRINTFTDSIIVPFKNMVNDSYSADASIKIRSHLECKRKNGDFTGSFAVYGYMKSPDNKNRLEIDKYAADIVRDIFKWKLEGLSQQGIADKLNENGILSPMEYKRFSGLRYNTTFKINHKARWSAVAVGRILHNEVYTGVLEQGKRVTPNYKIKQSTPKPKSEWVRVENSHNPIIEKPVFETVSALLKADTRIAAKGASVYPFSGIIVCGDCERNMVRKTIPKGGKKYYYFSCSTKRDDKTACTSHSINERDCEKAVFASLKAHIDSILNIDKMLKTIEMLPYHQDAIRKLETQIYKKQEEIERNSIKRLNLHEDYRSGIVTREDYLNFKKTYDMKIHEAEQAVIKQKAEIEDIARSKTASNEWIEKFKEYRSIDALNRKIVAELIDKIYVYEGGRICVVFRYQNEYKRLVAFLSCRSGRGAENAPLLDHASGEAV